MTPIASLGAWPRPSSDVQGSGPVLVFGIAKTKRDPMQASSASSSSRINPGLAIHVPTHIPCGPAENAAAYAGRPPANLLGHSRLAPHRLYHAIASYVALPEGARPPAFIVDASGKQVKVTIVRMSGFDVSVDVGGKIYDFDAANGEFAPRVTYGSGNARQSTGVLTRQRICDARVAANEQLFGRSIVSLKENLARVRALLTIPEDLRPAIVIRDYMDASTPAVLRDERQGIVRLEMTDRYPVTSCVFNLAKGQLNFEVSDADAEAHARYLSAMRKAGTPSPLLKRI